MRASHWALDIDLIHCKLQRLPQGTSNPNLSVVRVTARQLSEIWGLGHGLCSLAAKLSTVKAYDTSPLQLQLIPVSFFGPNIDLNRAS